MPSQSRAKAILKVVAESANRWIDDACYRMGASLAYYALFSLFPLTLLAVAVFGFFLGDDPGTRARILATIDPGSPGARAMLDETLKSMQDHRSARGLGAVIGFITLLFGASGVFGELDTSFTKIWRVPVKPMPFWKSVVTEIKDKALSFLLVVFACVLLLASLATSTIVTALSGSTESVLGHVPLFAWAWKVAEVGIGFGFLAVVFAAMFRILPQTRVAWRDVFPGAVITAVLFSMLKLLLAWYLGHVGSYAAYGAVGGVLALLTWIYVSSLVVFFGAEITRVWAEQLGSLRGTVAAAAPEAVKAKLDAEAELLLAKKRGDRVSDRPEHPQGGAHAHSIP
jgi:membrane protein